MRAYVIIGSATLSLFILGCTSQKTRISNYPDCSSDDISKMDTCLLGMPLREAIRKLNVDTSQFYAIEEPMAALRGIRVYPNESCEINLYVEKTLIKEEFNSSRIPDSSNFKLRDSLHFKNRYLFILDKPIKTVVWTKDSWATERTVYISEKE